MTRKKLNINGMLLLNKPLDISSNNILQRVKFLFSANKAGHTGALDPLATGMLPICFGETTKIANILLDGDKSYTVVAKLGERTNTSDREGYVISNSSLDKITLNLIDQTIKKQFIGDIKQQPTIWSAIKYQGNPLYEYARKGEEVPRPIRDITIYDIQIEQFNAPYLNLTVKCSKGTYIRTLIDDLGEALGCGAYVYQLHRNWVQGFEEQKMIDIAELEKLYANQDQQGLEKLLLPIDAPAQHLKSISLNEFQTWKLCQGMTIIEPQAKLDQLYRVYHPDYGYLGIAKAHQSQRLRGYRLVSTTQDIVMALTKRLPNQLINKPSTNAKPGC